MIRTLILFCIFFNTAAIAQKNTNPEDIASSGQTSRSDPMRQIDSKTPKTFVFGATVMILARWGAAYQAFSYPDYTVGVGIACAHRSPVKRYIASSQNLHFTRGLTGSGTKLPVT